MRLLTPPHLSSTVSVSVSLRVSLRLSRPRPQVGRTFDPATAFVVDDLKPNTEYAFRLAARSPQGLGAFTSVVRQRTLQSSRCLVDPALTCGGDPRPAQMSSECTDPGRACRRGLGGRLRPDPAWLLHLGHDHRHQGREGLGCGVQSPCLPGGRRHVASSPLVWEQSLAAPLLLLLLA